VKHATLIILLLTLTAALALGAGNNWRNERPITSGGNYPVIKAAIASSGYRAAMVVYTRGPYFASSPVKVAASEDGGVTWTLKNDLPNGAQVMWGTGNNSYRPLAAHLRTGSYTVEVVYAGWKDGEGNGVYYLLSNDLGDNWSDGFKVGYAPNPYDVIYSVAIKQIRFNSGPAEVNNTVVVWSYHNDSDGNTYIKFRRRNNLTGIWDNEQTLTSWTGEYAPHVDVDANFGDIPPFYITYVVWNNPVPGNGDIYYRLSTNGGTSWGTVYPLEDNPGISTFPAVKLKSNMQAFVLWENGGGIRSKRIGGPASVQVPGGGTQPRVAIDAMDSLYLVRTGPTSPYRVTAAKSLNGYNDWINLGEIQLDPNSPNGNLRCPDVASTYTDGIMRLFVWNGYIPPPTDQQELWIGVNDIGKPDPPSTLQAVKFCNPMLESYVEVSHYGTWAWDDSGYNIYKSEPKCGPPWNKLNTDIVIGYSYWDFDIPQTQPECDVYCACYMARSVDLALNEGGDSNTSQVGACDASAMQPATLIAAVALGQSTPSPYTQRRAGNLVWGSGKSADMDPERLEYRIRGLDTSAYYVLDFGYYAPDTSRVAAARSGDVVLHGPKRLTEKQVCLPVHLPKETYASGTFPFTVEKVEGPNVLLGKFRLWRMPEGYRGGPQSAGLATRKGVQPYLAPPRPNPSTGEVFLGYWLPKPGEATLRIYNTAGQLVREVDTGQKNAGTHYLVWDGKNASGQRVTNGVYLVRLSAGSVSATQKVTILR